MIQEAFSKGGKYLVQMTKQALETGARLYRERGDALSNDGIQIHLKVKP